MLSQCALMKFQASACPGTFLAMELIVDSTSISHLLSGFRVYSRYLQDQGESGIHLIRAESIMSIIFSIIMFDTSGLDL